VPDTLADEDLSGLLDGGFRQGLRVNDRPPSQTRFSVCRLQEQLDASSWRIDARHLLQHSFAIPTCATPELLLFLCIQMLVERFNNCILNVQQPECGKPIRQLLF